MAIKVATALNCRIASFTKFDRKNYFYPDLPKGYQISQYDLPLAEHGWLGINFLAKDGLAGRLDDEQQMKRIDILRLHLEEDAAKSVHEKKSTLIDYNRGGAPLIEIVTQPHFSTPQEAKTFGQELQLVVRYLNVSDADMEKGQLRCDANISLRPEGDPKLYPKTEIKNINSFRALERSLAFEINRQALLWTTGQPSTKQETRGWSDAKQETISQRSKEGAEDYRYFPEPDLPPLTFTKEQLEAFSVLNIELPQAKRRRFMEDYGFNPDETKILTESKQFANYTEEIISELRAWLNTLDNTEGTEKEIWTENKKKLTKLLAGWLINKFMSLLQTKKILFEKNKITPENFAEFITLVYQNKIGSSAAQIILEEMVKTGADPSNILSEKDLGQTCAEEDLNIAVEKIINANPEQVKQFTAGKKPIIKYLIGLVMKETKGKADPQTVEKMLKDQLE